MNKNIPIALAAATLLAAAMGPAWAQTKAKYDLGKREYEAKCVVCHGSQGKGDGSYAELLKRPAADLSVLKRNNGGIFPVARVYASIDGREMVKSHGDRDMPVWGRDYSLDKVGAGEYFVDVPYDAEAFVRSRILALIDYLNRLQVQ